MFTTPSIPAQRGETIMLRLEAEAGSVAGLSLAVAVKEAALGIRVPPQAAPVLITPLVIARTANAREGWDVIIRPDDTDSLPALGADGRALRHLILDGRVSGPAWQVLTDPLAIVLEGRVTPGAGPDPGLAASPLQPGSPAGNPEGLALVWRGPAPGAGLRAALIGPPGAGSALTVTHTQAAPALVWTINHNLGFRPAVSVLSVGGLELLGATVTHVSAQQLTIAFSAPTAGSARLT